jgi:hypothetical protein
MNGTFTTDGNVVTTRLMGASSAIAIAVQRMVRCMQVISADIVRLSWPPARLRSRVRRMFAM